MPLSWGGAEKEEVIATWQGAGEGANDEEPRIITHSAKKPKARRLACRANPRTFERFVAIHSYPLAFQTSDRHDIHAIVTAVCVISGSGEHHKK